MHGNCDDGNEDGHDSVRHAAKVGDYSAPQKQHLPSKTFTLRMLNKALTEARGAGLL